MYCNQCGHRNPEGSNFCSSCGAVLDRPEHTTITLVPVESAGEVGDDEMVFNVADLPDNVAALVVKRGPNAGSQYLLSGPLTTIGRHPDSDIFLDDVTVSRRHAEVRREDDNYRVSDVGSLNGTYLNRQRIEAARLGHGDELQVGKFRLVFLSTAGEPSTAEET
jgi:pSer/pThr/pTyr-binding forkhead associated (FHA) protein